MMISFFDRVDNIVGKGESIGDLTFSPIPTVFSKGYFIKVLKSWDCVV